jgi:hypothetical protein
MLLPVTACRPVAGTESRRLRSSPVRADGSSWVVSLKTLSLPLMRQQRYQYHQEGQQKQCHSSYDDKAIIILLY